MEKDIASLQHTTYTLDSLLRTGLRPTLFLFFIDKTSRYTNYSCPVEDS